MGKLKLKNGEIIMKNQINNGLFPLKGKKFIIDEPSTYQVDVTVGTNFDLIIDIFKMALSNGLIYYGLSTSEGIKNADKNIIRIHIDFEKINKGDRLLRLLLGIGKPIIEVKSIVNVNNENLEIIKIKCGISKTISFWWIILFPPTVIFIIPWNIYQETSNRPLKATVKEAAEILSSRINEQLLRYYRT